MNVGKTLKGFPPVVVFAAIGFGVCMANYYTVRWLNYPPVYCWGLKLTPMFDPWWAYAKLFVVAFFAWEAVRFRLFRAAVAAMACVFLFGLPEFFEAAFRLGGSCG